MEQSTREAANKAGEILSSQGYQRTHAPYAFEAYTHNKALLENEIVMTTGLANFFKKTDEQNFHFVSFFVDANTPNNILMSGVGLSRQDAKSGAVVVEPIAAVSVHDFVADIKDQSAADYFSGLNRPTTTAKRFDRKAWPS